MENGEKMERDHLGRLLPGHSIKLGKPSLGSGPNKKVTSKVALEVKKHPDRAQELLEDCYRMAKSSPDDRLRLEAIKYYVDRIKGKPKVSLGLAEEDKDLLTAATVLKFYDMIDEREGEFREIEPGVT